MNILVTILSFSSRKNGNCANICKYISKHYHDYRVKSVTISAETVPACGKCDCECLTADKRCPHLSEEYMEIMDGICQSDLVYFIVPNYCGIPCSNYFAFNERSVGYFNKDREIMERYMNVPKRFVIVSNTEGFEDMMRQQTIEEPDILYLKSRKYQKQSVAGDILESTEAIFDLNAFLATNGL